MCLCVSARARRLVRARSTIPSGVDTRLPLFRLLEPSQRGRGSTTATWFDRNAGCRSGILDGGRLAAPSRPVIALSDHGSARSDAVQHGPSLGIDVGIDDDVRPVDASHDGRSPRHQHVSVRPRRLRQRRAALERLWLRPRFVRALSADGVCLPRGLRGTAAAHPLDRPRRLSRHAQHEGSSSVILAR